MPPRLRAALIAATRALRALAFDQRMAAGLFALVALLPLLTWLLGGGYILHLAGRAMILAVAGISLELLIGVCGMVLFGHAAFLGIGAYAAGIAASHGHGTLALALPAALAASAVFSLLTGAIAVRTRGVYFIMITLAFGQMAYFVATSLAPYGGDDGLGWPGRTLVFGTQALKNETAFFYAALGAAAAAYVVASRLAASRFGRVLRGLTGSEMRLQAIGFAPYPFRLAAYVIAGTMCGAAGFLLGNHAEFVSPAYMHWQRSGELIVIVLLGGTGTTYGPVLGAVVYVLLEEVLSGLTEHWKAILGPILVVVALFAKGGMAGAIEQTVAAWRRNRPGPREVLDALAAFAAGRAAAWSAAASARGEQAAEAVRRQRDLVWAIVERSLHRAGVRIVIWSRDLEAARAQGIARLSLRCHRGLAEARARWKTWWRSAGRCVHAMGTVAEQDLAKLFRRGRSLAFALERQLARLLALLRGAIAGAQAYWQPWKMALGQRLVSLVVLAERNISDAAHRWRRR
jgi:branched-chain amino acid transport system permease protein